MRITSIAVGALLALGLAGCTAQPAPTPTTHTSTPMATATHSATKPASIVIAAAGLTVTDASGSVHRFAYDQWSDGLVSLATGLLKVAPRTSSGSAFDSLPATTTYLWPELFLIHSDWAANVANVERLTVFAQGIPASTVTISTPSGVRVGDSAAAVAGYPVFCNSNKKCFENVSTSSGASTTLRVLDSSGTHLVLGYVDATTGVTDIITADTSWGTKSGIDVRD